MGVRDGRQFGAGRLLQYHAQAMAAEVAKDEVAGLARQRVERQFPSQRTVRIHTGRNGIGSSAAARGMAHRLPNTGARYSWTSLGSHIARFCAIVN